MSDNDSDNGNKMSDSGDDDNGSKISDGGDDDMIVK
jgi:hypothetical protein